jgi:hypothetical protein
MQALENQNKVKMSGKVDVAPSGQSRPPPQDRNNVDPKRPCPKRP